MVKGFEAFKTLKNIKLLSALEDFFAIKEEWQSFSVTLYLILLFVLSSSLMYIAEHDAQPETFSSF